MRRVVPVETVEATLLTPPVHRRAELAKWRGRVGGAVGLVLEGLARV